MNEVKEMAAERAAELIKSTGINLKVGQIINRPTLDESVYGELKFEDSTYRIFLTEDEHPLLVQKRDEFGHWNDFLSIDNGGRAHYEW